MRTTDDVQRRQLERQAVQLAATIARLDWIHVMSLDDIAYVTKNQAEISVPFELITARHERRSLMITADQPFR
jgi:DNA replication protein DnaC